jgi:hypothetical protein
MQDSSQDSDGGFEHTNDAMKTKNEMIAPPKPRFTNSSDNPLSLMIMRVAPAMGMTSLNSFI